MPEKPTEEVPAQAPAAPAPAIPNFREDERLQQRYTGMLERRIKSFYLEHESSIRRNASTKRDELREESSKAQAEWDRCTAIADEAREAYRLAYPNNVKKTRLLPPSMVDNLRSLGAASKLHHAAEEAWRNAEHAASEIRRIEHNENQLDIELKKALERAPAVSKEVTESEKWLAEIHAEEELAAVKAKVDAVVAEREAYAQRLAAGNVSPDEQRLRAFAEQNIKHVALPLKGMMFLRIDEFGPKAYLIVRDIAKQHYALPYDRRLEPMLDGVYDIVERGKEADVRRGMRDNGQPLSLFDHFRICSDNNDEAAHQASRQHHEFLRRNRMLASMTEVDETEARVIGLLVDFAKAKAH